MENTVRIPGSYYSYESHGIFAPIGTLDGAVQPEVPSCLHPFHHLSCYSKLAESLQVSHVHHNDTWALLSAQGQQRLQESQRLPRLGQTPGAHNEKMSQRYISRPTCIWNLWPLVYCDHTGNNAKIPFFILITDLCTKLTSASQSRKTSSLQFSPFFYDHWIVSFGILAFLLSSSVFQFVEMFLGPSCKLLRVDLLTTSTHPLQAKGHSKCYNSNFIPCWCLNHGVHQRS